jgi:hypothetical protein
MIGPRPLRATVVAPAVASLVIARHGTHLGFSRHSRLHLVHRSDPSASHTTLRQRRQVGHLGCSLD